MKCPPGQRKNPKVTKMYPNECLDKNEKRRCPDGHRKTKKGCVPKMDTALMNSYYPKKSRTPVYREYTQADIDDLKPKPVYGPKPKLSPQIRVATRRTVKSNTPFFTPENSSRKSTRKRGFFSRFF